MSHQEALPTQHPGEHLRQILVAREMQQNDLAFILGLQSANGINTIVQGKRGISPEMSKALGEALQLPHDHFANLQKAYDLACADAPDPAVSLRAAMLNTYPIREMIKRGWIRDTGAEELQAQLAQFFGVKNANEIPYLSHAAKKTSYEQKEIPPAQLAWLFRVKQIAGAIAVPPYSQQALENTLAQMRSLLAAPEEARNVPRLLAECGVRFVIVETLPNAKIDGVCFWLGKNSPVIGLSARHDRIDNFWFVLRHEIEHVLKGHGKDGGIIDADLEGDRAGVENTLPEEERVANDAAADFCVPKAKLDSFIARKKPFFYEKDVLAFAKINAVHPGLVVGQIQHKLNRYDYLKKYQVKVRQCVLPGAMADGWGQSVPI